MFWQTVAGNHRSMGTILTVSYPVTKQRTIVCVLLAHAGIVIPKPSRLIPDERCTLMIDKAVCLVEINIGVQIISINFMA